MIDLRLGDCLDLLPSLPDASIDAVIADIPYGTTACKWDTVIPFAPMWAQLKRICKGAICLTGSQPFSSVLVSSNLEMFRHEWIWKKDRGSNFANTVREPMKEHEHVLVFSRNGYTYNKQMQERKASGLARVKYDFQMGAPQSSEVYRQFKGEGRRLGKTLRVPSSVQEIRRETGLHPTQKPVALMEYLIRTYTNEGDTVLDFTCGSGTTLVACVNTNRNGIGVEKDAGYFEIAQRRVSEAQQQMALPLEV